MIGMFFGSYFAGILSDHIGRKRTWVISMACCGICILASSFVRDIYSYFTLRTLLGMFGKGNAMILFIIIVEIVGSDYRTIYAITTHVLF